MPSAAPANLFPSALETSFASYRIGMALHAAWPDDVIVEGGDSTFDLDGFTAAGHCSRTPAGVHLQVNTRWNAPFLAEPKLEEVWAAPYTVREPRKVGDGTLTRATGNGVYEVRWQEHELRVALATWSEGSCNHFHFWVLARDRDTAEAFVVAVCRFGHAPRQEILVINGERWKKDPDLHAAIRASSLDDLVLPAPLRSEIVEDFTTFLAAREDYARLGVPWKRGVLLLGPPGNGKTHCLRGVLGMLDLPTIYVQSFRSRYDTDERNIEEIFDRARRIAPCALVFEDLDAQITPGNRSFFLNQLDGFSPNAGLLVLATTNHPERLDPAIVERPSRFDRKYHFPLPGPEGRTVFLQRWTERLDRSLKLTAEQHAELVAETDGFSFAYLKELCLASVLRWMKLKPADGLHPLLRAQLEVLRAQMRSEQDGTVEPKAKPGGQGAVQELLGVLQHALAHAKSEEDGA